MTTKTKTTKATTTARNAKKATKAQTAKPKTKDATVAKRDAKESKLPKPTDKKLSQIEAAIIILGKSKEAMNCKAMVEAMQAAGLWSSPGGATPEATLYASILRELNTKGKDARFKKTERGHFTLVSK
jgi:hypothetical protein